MRRRHALPFAVHNQSSKQTGLLRGRAERSRLTIASELLLDELPEFSVDDRLVLAWIDFSLVPDLAAIDLVLQQGIERTARKAVAARQDATGALAALADDAKPVKLVPQQPAPIRVPRSAGRSCEPSRPRPR